MEPRAISDIAKYTGLNMLEKGLSISPLKLQKLLYYEQAWYMVFFNKNMLFKDVPEAWVNGPVYRDIWYEYKEKVPSMFDSLQRKDFIKEDEPIENAIKQLASSMELTTTEIEFLDSVFNTYGTKSQDQLVFLTHSEIPWAEKREGLLPFEHSDRKISLVSMFNYYNDRLQRRRNRNA